MIKDDVPLISVIVPVFNVEKYLDRCIKSILNQTYTNIEILMIDDGSTDNSRCICENYAREYKNVYVYHQKNQGLASARNSGLDKCHGIYIGFVDSDDYIADDMYEYLYKILNDNNADCASIRYALTTKDKIDQEKKNYSIENVAVYSGENILYQHLLEVMKTGSHSVCRCMFKRSALENVRFPLGLINEDIPFKFEALVNVSKMVDSSLVKYYYYQKGESITRGGFKEKDLDLFKATNLLLEMAKEHSESIYRLAKGKHLRGYFSILARIAFYGSAESKERTWEVVRMCQEHLRSNYLFLLRMPLPLSRKLLIVLFCVNFTFTTLLIRMIKNLIRS